MTTWMRILCSTVWTAQESHTQKPCWEATVEYHDYVQWNESFGVPVDTFDVFLNDYPKAVKDNIMKEYAEDSKKWGGQQQEHGRFDFI